MEYCLHAFRSNVDVNEGVNIVMTSGMVKWFSNAKGYGFISPDKGEEDIFAHFSAIDMDGYKTLKKGQRVKFEVNNGPKGLQAAKITFNLEDLPTSETEH